MSKSLFELVNLKEKADTAYYLNNGEDSIMSDQEYDELKKQIRAIDPNHETLTKVGARFNTNTHLEVVPLKSHMGSITNSDTYGDDYKSGFIAWYKRMAAETGEENPELISQPKVDGLSVELQYLDGKLVDAITRGDGTKGERILLNVSQFKDVPIFTKNKFTGTVRGEAVLLKKDFAVLAEETEEELSNPRNVGAGIARRKDSTNSNLMSFRAFDCTDNTRDFAFFDRKVALLVDLGFTVPATTLIKSLEQAIKVHDHFQEVRASMDYEMDGVVYKLNNLNVADKLGIDNENCPRSMVAFKFPAPTATTVLNNVRFQVGHTGAIAPVAEVEPVTVLGVTVSNATLCNWDYIKAKDIHIGDTVEVSRRGDVIPCIERVLKPHPERQKIWEPIMCPVCGGEVARKKKTDGTSGAVTVCLNPDCSAKQVGKIKRWATSLDIKGLGDEVITMLTSPVPVIAKDGAMEESEPIVKSIADLYKLKTITGPYADGKIGAEFLAECSMNGKKFGLKRAKNLIEEIEITRYLTIDQFLGSLGIEGLGKGRVKLIREAYKKWYATTSEDVPHDSAYLFDHVDSWLVGNDGYNDFSFIENYAKVCGIPNIAHGIQVSIENMRPIIMELLKYIHVGEIVEVKKQIPTGPLTGKVFCFTGKFPKKESEYVAMLTPLGGIVEDDLRDNVNILVQADPSKESSKAKKAKKKGIPVMDEATLLRLIADAQELKG